MKYGVRRAPWIPWIIKRQIKWVLEQIKPKMLLEAKMTKLEAKLSYFCLLYTSDAADDL